MRNIVRPVGLASVNGLVSVAMETPTGAVNGVNKDFVFTHPPKQVFYQGILQNGTDYSLAGSTVTFVTAPTTGAVVGLLAS